MIDAELLAHVAGLARLGLDDAERESLRADLETILGHFQAIQDVDTEGVEPLAHVMQSHGEPRTDTVVPFADGRELLVSPSAHHREGFFIVPRVLEGPADDATDPAPEA